MPAFTTREDPRRDRLRQLRDLWPGNAAMRVDPYLGNTTLIDPVGGSAVFYDTQVKLVRV